MRHVTQTKPRPPGFPRRLLENKMCPKEKKREIRKNGGTFVQNKEEKHKSGVKERKGKIM